jgi:hypothetical protein
LVILPVFTLLTVIAFAPIAVTPLRPKTIQTFFGNVHAVSGRIGMLRKR